MVHRLPFLSRRPSAAEKPLREELASTEQLEERAKALAARFTLDPDPRRGGERILRRLDDNARLLDGAYRALADELVRHTDSRLDRPLLIRFLKSFQSVAPLSQLSGA